MRSPDSPDKSPLLSSLSAALAACDMRGKTVLVAVSGGGDSLALLYALYNLRPDFDLQLRGAHLNHNLRAAASHADAAFVQDTFRQLNIPCHIHSADVAAYRRARSLSLEDAARRLRYRFLAGAAIRHKADAVAVAHTADDQAETLLMHIIRGSGLTGLRGMQPLERLTIANSELTLFRPLLDVTRAQTYAYCAALGLQPRHDETNLSLEHTRNRIRHELLPLIERVNPAARAALLRLARNAAEDAAYIQQQAHAAWREIARQSDSGIIALDAPALARQHPAIQSRILRRAAQAALGNSHAIELSRAHILAMRQMLTGPAGKTLPLPGGVLFATGYGEVRIGQADAVKATLRLPPIAGEFPLAIPGETHVGGWRITAAVCDNADRSHASSSVEDALCASASSSVNNAAASASSAASETLDLDRLGGALHLRARHPGDRFQPLGMTHSKKLQDFMVDERIPRETRDSIPLLVSNKGIACVIGYRIAHWARVRQDTRRRLHLRFTRAETAEPPP